MDTFIKLVKNNIRQYTMLIALVLAMILFGILTGGTLLVPQNITNLILQNAYVFILGIGMMILLINGGNIDLSAGSVVAFIGAVVGILLINWHWPMWLGILVALVIGAVIGAWQGYWVAYIRVPGFIVTLAGMLLFRGLTLTITKGLTISPFNSAFTKIAMGYVPDYINSSAPILKPEEFTSLGYRISHLSSYNYIALVVGALIVAAYIVLQLRSRMNKQKFTSDITPMPLFIAQLVVVSIVILVFFLWLALYEGLPIIFIIIGLLVLGYQFYMAKTAPGRYIYAMGGNEKAAKLSGVNTNKVLFYCYVNMGVMSAVAAIATASRLVAASPIAGQNYEFDAITACFVGGASMYGGVGTAAGAIIGALFMGVLNNGMSILGYNTDVQSILKGLVLLVAVGMDIFSKTRSQAALGIAGRGKKSRPPKLGRASNAKV
jgi:putative multiple sugar transport system permease protein